MNELKELEITFENCEYMTIPRNIIGTFRIDGIHDVVSRLAINSICKYKVADTVVMELYKEGDTEYFPFGSLDEITKFDRLTMYHDITRITVKYKDNTEETFIVKYEDESETPGADNAYQKTYTSNLGNLYIVIDKNPLDHWFAMEYINDSEQMDFEKDMLDIGIDEPQMQNYADYNLPDMYRYVYLFDDDGHDCLAMRVYDKDSDWKFVYDPDSTNHIHCPIQWMYPDSKMEESMRIGETVVESFSLGAILNKYPKEGFYET